MRKLINLALNYDLQGLTDKDKAMLSVNLINHAFNHNYKETGMDRETSFIYRDLINALKDSEGVCILSRTEFNILYSEVNKSKFPPQFALHAPVLFDQLDEVKNRGEAEEDKLIKDYERSKNKTADKESKTD